MTAPARHYLLQRPEHGGLAIFEPGEPGPNELLIRVAQNGVCASDLTDWSLPQPEYPFAIGHEPVGQVVSIGSGVAIPVGAWVTGRISPSFADYATADAADAVVVPDGLDPAVVLGEPVGCVVEGLRRTRVGAGSRVAVIGTGFMGLVMIQLLAHSPVAAVVAIDPRADARAVAVTHGADDAIDPSVAVAGRSEVFDVVVEASGTAAGLELATHLVRAHGTISILGYHQAARTVAMDEWNRKALDIVNAHVRDATLMREAVRVGLDLQASGRLDIGSLISHRYTPDRIDHAFADLRSKPPGFTKAVIIW